MRFRELCTTILNICVFVAATWAILWIGADTMDQEYITGVLIVALFIVAEALHLDPGKGVRILGQKLLHTD